MQQSGQDNRIKLESMKEKALLGGGAKRIEAQHKKGKLTARDTTSLKYPPNHQGGSKPPPLRGCGSSATLTMKGWH